MGQHKEVKTHTTEHTSIDLTDLRLPPWEIMDRLRKDATSYGYLHVITGAALTLWKENYLQSVEDGIIPSKWLMKHGAYTLVVPKEATKGEFGFEQLRTLAYKDLGALDNAALVLFQLKVSARWNDRADPEQNLMRQNSARQNEEWDTRVFNKTRGRNNLYLLASEAKFLTSNSLVGNLGFYPVIKNAQQVAKAIFFIPDEGAPNSHKRFEAFPSKR